MFCPNTLAVMISYAAVALAQGKSADEIAWLGTVLTQLGDTLSTIATQQELIEAKCNALLDSQQ